MTKAQSVFAASPAVALHSSMLNVQTGEVSEFETVGDMVLTPFGPVLRLEFGMYRGLLHDEQGEVAEMVYGAPIALYAIGATDLTPAC